MICSICAREIPPGRSEDHHLTPLLVDCLEHHFGSLGNALVIPGKLETTLREIEILCQKALKGQS